MALVFSYKGFCEKFCISPGSYVFVLWGAQGGNCGYNESGRGGYTKAKIALNHSQQFIVCVGGEGSSSYSEFVEGGFNGGGRNGKSPHANESCGGSGGGATDIRIPGLPLDDRILVAGGGGGASEYYFKGDFRGYRLGGYGGGNEGGKYSGNSDDYHYQNGNGGNQTNGGKGGHYNSHLYNPSCSGTDGMKGTGGDGNATAYAGAGGGGGGYYGGGGGADVGSGGGGSGYISEEFFYNGKLIPGNTEFPSPYGNNEVGHSGNGYARITVLLYQSWLSKNYFRSSIALLFTAIGIGSHS